MDFPKGRAVSLISVCVEWMLNMAVYSRTTLNALNLVSMLNVAEWSSWRKKMQEEVGSNYFLVFRMGSVIRILMWNVMMPSPFAVGREGSLGCRWLVCTFPLASYVLMSKSWTLSVFHLPNGKSLFETYLTSLFWGSDEMFVKNAKECRSEMVWWVCGC